MGKKKKDEQADKAAAPKRVRVKVDRDAMRKDKKRADQRSGGADLHQLADGNTSFYICGPVHADYPKSIVEGAVHFQFGPSNKTVSNLEGLEDYQAMTDALESKGLTWDDAKKGWDFANDKTAGGGGRDELRPRWYIAVVPWAHRSSEDDEWEEFDEKTVEILACGKTIYDGVFRAMFEESDDITDPYEAILVYISRKGKGRETKYNISSARRGITIPKKIWAKIETALQPGGPGDMFRLLAGMTRSFKDVKALWRGDAEGETEVKTRKSRRDDEPGKSKSVREKREERKAGRSGSGDGVSDEMAAESRKRSKKKKGKKK